MPTETQGGLFDTTIEDPALEGLLERMVELEAPKKEYRTVRKDIRKALEERYADSINIDGENGGWVRIGRMRFRARSKPRAEGEVKIGAGINFSLDAEPLL